jgi:hypothetical protein
MTYPSTIEKQSRFHYAAATVTIAVSDIFTYRLAAMIAGGSSFAARSAEAAHYEPIAVPPKPPSARTGASVTSVLDPDFLVTQRSYRTFNLLPSQRRSRLPIRLRDAGAPCRALDEMLSRPFVCLLSPESQSGPFGPKPLFGLLAFS